MRHRHGEKIDQYEIIEELGEGAYAETYKARDTRTGEVVMLKSPNPVIFADPHVFQRFRREADIAEKLDHPGVQRSLDLRNHRSEPYLVLEYIDGKNLRRRLSEFDDGAPIELAEEWGRQLAETLAYLHSRGITHRDLKPENILIGKDGRLKIVDFGSAMMIGARRLTWRHLTESLGTPDYMSPEQIQGGRGDERSDIYSWGVMVYEFLTGRVPFEGDNWLAVMAGHLQRTPRRIRELRPEVSPALEAVVLKAMRRHPENRYRSADDLLVDLNNLEKVDASTFDLSPEAPVGGMAAAESPKQLLTFAALIAFGFMAFVVLVVLISVVMKR